MQNSDSSSLLPLKLGLCNSKGHLEKILLLLRMHALQTSGDRGTGVTASIHDVLAVVVLSLVEKSLDSGLGKAPCTSVQGLFLAPDDSLGVRVLIQVLLELLPREGVQLLKASEGDIVDLVVATVLVEGTPDLARAEDNTLDLLGALNSTSLMLRIGNQRSEASIGVCELLNVGACERVTQQRLGEENDQSYI